MKSLDDYINERWNDRRVQDALRLLGDNQMTNTYFVLAWTKQYYDELEAKQSRPDLSRIWFQIKIEGGGEFPFDNLRRFQCWPADTLSAGKLGITHHRAITLAMIGNWSEAQACVERFQSFGWTAEIEKEEVLS